MPCQSKPVVPCPVCGTLMNVYVPKGLDSSISLLCCLQYEQLACLVGSGWFHSTPAAGLGGHLRVSSGIYSTLVSLQLRLWPHGASASLHDPSVSEFLLQWRLPFHHWAVFWPPFRETPAHTSNILWYQAEQKLLFHAWPPEGDMTL